MAKVPEGVDLTTAGGVPLVGLTAWQSLHFAKPQPGQRLLVMAAAGGGCCCDPGTFLIDGWS